MKAFAYLTLFLSLFMFNTGANAKDFYKNKTITITTGTGAGGSFTVHARLFSKYFRKHVPGNPTVIVQAMPGGGGTRVASYMANAAPKDGTYISMPLPGSILSPILRKKLKYDSGTFQWLGSLAAMPGVISVWTTAPATTLEQLQTVEVILPTSSKFSEAYLFPAFMNAVLGTKFRIIPGYRGGARMDKSMLVGETHGRMNYWEGWSHGKPHWLPKLVHLVQFGKPIAALPNVPSLMSLMKTEEHKRMVEFLETTTMIGRALYVPAGVSQDRVDILRVAFNKTVTDPEYLADLANRNMVINVIPGPELQKIVERAANTPKELIVKLKALVKLK